MSLSFEEIFCLPEPQIQQIIKTGGYQSVGFVADRYIATALLANNGSLRPEDMKYAINQRFPEVYLDDNLLMESNMNKYASRFEGLRKILGGSVCNEEGIQAAINKYGVAMLGMPLKSLIAEFGQTIFDYELLRELYGGFNITIAPWRPENLISLLFKYEQKGIPVEMSRQEEAKDFFRCLRDVLLKNGIDYNKF